MQDFLFYLKLGWEHIISLDALDHQLFVLALIAVYSYKDLKKILILVTAFTIGHSITLALSILDIVRVPSNWVEFLIPLTIVLTALGNIIMKNKKQALDKTNYYLALFFGLIHGMGFANTARVMIAKSQSIAIPLLGFNIGLEVGQIVIVCAILILLFIALTLFKINRKDWILFISSGVFALALKMTIERIPF
ncbi:MULTISPECIES: HupE/UreJ family protein [Chryseobacterium]|uniref:HupE/UreJ family protein n=1 Tax=Chryseobacterium TaxID=59732 RepID=UPI001551B7DD|nr:MULTISPECIES: HupE/UreJ family protein [unclassified Chryseobacterium]MDC8105394.1 HupE/UreJ family protein [Chryseobacterium sp. B21-037]MDQ1805648.1 HupE/UreJ family protein [Chryseobacterium sp. CKR4-1]WBV58804.1 HupE/UreJ family protein [Chryseobacterium daecheongense]